MHLHHIVLARIRLLPALKERAAWHNLLPVILVLPVALTPMIFAAFYYD
jgi:hypothetical protein